MARIKQLTPSEAQKIAAGQVVERPANVIKELVENALDASARHINIYVEDAGKKLIRIVDDGSGMGQEDAHLCFKHHATSKITSVEQLAHLQTFGFRGEALSSIAAVSKITLISKEADALLGTHLYLESLRAVDEKSITCNTGTDIQVADLFYNVPARKKFLKTNDTEWHQIQLLFQAFCLDYKHVHFSLYHQNSLVYNCPPVTDLSSRISQLYDHTIASQLIPISFENNGITLEGVISAHTYGRFDRSAIFFLVNKRWVKNYNLSKTLLKGYANVLPPNKYPLACVHITLDPAQVDINIHPRKEEVQFLHPRIIEQTIQAAVKAGLENNLSMQLQKKVNIAPDSRWQPNHISRSFNAGVQPLQVQSQFAPPPFAYEMPKVITPAPETHINANFLPSSTSFDPIQSLERMPNTTHDFYDIQIIGQLHKTYILIEEKDGLFIVDQHAAHECILYEQFATRFEDVATIALLFPPIITLSDHEIGLLMAHQEVFTRNHITLEQLGANQVIVNAIPVHLKEINMIELVNQTIGWIEENQKCDPESFYKKVNEKLHAQMACKAAVKAGDVLMQTQMHQLIMDLQKVNNRFTCPHGRPTGWNISLYEIEKKFKRKL